MSELTGQQIQALENPEAGPPRRVNRRAQRLAFGVLALLAAAQAAPRAVASEAAKLLPEETDIVLSINCRQLRQETWLRQSEPVHDFLKHWQSYLRANEMEFTTYLRSQPIFQAAGLKEHEQDFLRMAQTLKGHHDTVGLDVLNDIDRVTLGFLLEPGSQLAILEGRFAADKFMAWARGSARKSPASFEILRLAGHEVWHRLPTEGRDFEDYTVLLNATTLVNSPSKDLMEKVLEQAAGGKARGGGGGGRSLLAHGEKEHVVFVLGAAESFLEAVARGLKEQPVPAQEWLMTWARDQALALIRQFGQDVRSLSVAASFGGEELRLQFGVATKKPQPAQDLAALIRRGNFLAGLVLQNLAGDTARGLREILRGQRIRVEDGGLFVRVQVPYAFMRMILEGPWL